MTRPFRIERYVAPSANPWDDVPVRGFQDQLGDVSLPVSSAWRDRYYYDDATKQKNADEWVDSVLKRYGDGNIQLEQRDEMTRISHDICTLAHEERVKRAWLRRGGGGGGGPVLLSQHSGKQGTQPSGLLLTPTFGGVTKPAAFALQRYLTEVGIVEEEAKQRERARWARVVGGTKRKV